MKKVMSCLLLAAWFPVLIFAAEPVIQVENPRARESPPTVTTGAAYLTLINNGSEADRLLGVSGEVAEKIELHAHLHKDGVMKMQTVESLALIPGEPAVFEPGGLHIMLIGLKQALAKDETFTLTLHFEKAGDIPVEVTVKGMQAMH